MRKLYIILFLLYFSNIKSQQISQYSNFLETAFYLNPAISSLGKNLKILHRNQWTGFQGAPKTTFISYQSSFLHKKDLKSVSISSIGGFIQNEKMGAFRNFKAKFSYSYSFLINSVDILPIETRADQSIVLQQTLPPHPAKSRATRYQNRS